MATRDESHMFSLAALTERSPSAVPAPKRAFPDPDNIDLGELAGARSFAADFGPPVYPLTGPRADSERVHPNAAGRTTPLVQIALIVSALLVAAGIIATALWSVQTPTPPSPLTETLSKPETTHRTNAAARSVATAAAARPIEAVAEPTPSSAASSGRPSIGEASASQTRRPSRRVQTAVRSKPATPTPVPARPGPCSHCPPQDLACNIKCRAKG